MKSFIILSLSFLTIAAIGQQDSVSNHAYINSNYYTNQLTGLWKFTGDNNYKAANNTNRKLLFTSNEIIFYTNDSITRKETFTIISDTIYRRINKANYFLIHLTHYDEYWSFLFFSPAKSFPSLLKPITLLLNTDPICACTCPYELYDRIDNSNFVFTEKRQ